MSRFVRQSKYRHIFGKQNKSADCFLDTKLTRNAWDQNYCVVNPTFVALCWQTGGGGAVAVMPQDKTGRQGDVKLITGHKRSVLNCDWNPFNDHLLATVSEDCHVRVWQIPEGGLTQNLGLEDCVQDLQGHGRKIGTCDFNPVANNVLCTSASDYTVRLWDIEAGKETYKLEGTSTNIIQSVAWNFNGSLLAQLSKDKKVKVIDPRDQKIAQEGDSHPGVKGGRTLWLGRKEKIFTVGFSKSSQRQYAIWDPKNLSKPLIGPTSIDSASGIIMPFFDADTNVLYLAGKGDGNIRFYEITDDAKIIYSLSEFKTNKPARGMGFMPKRGVNVSKNETARFYKVHETQVEPISFIVPRKSDLFQEDLFPDCASAEPALSAEQWMSGENAEPKTQSMAPGFVAPVVKKEFNPVKAEVEKELTPKEMKEEIAKLKNRVTYLEAELVQRDAKIKELSS